jgi:hypothetical protein
VGNRSLLALCWGVAGTVWATGGLGFALAHVAQSPGMPAIPLRRVARAVVWLLCAAAACAAVTGLIGFELSRRGIISLPATTAEVIPRGRYNQFAAVWFAHIASYAAGLIGGTVLIARLWRERGRPKAFRLLPNTAGGLLRVAALLGLAVVVFYFRACTS